MNSEKNFSIPFNNQIHNLNFDQVKELLKIKQYNETRIDLQFTLKDKRKLVGKVIEYKAIYTTSPMDIYIPLTFKIKTPANVEVLTFTEIDSIVRVSK